MIFELDNVELYFRTKRILNGIYLKAETGKVTGLLGRNGSGKSCLLSIAFGDLKAKYKLIRIDNTPILKPLYTTGIVKYLPQYHFVLERMKLRTAFQLFDVNWDAFTGLFDEFSNLENFKTGKLSGGQRRLIETYITLTSPSQLVLLDEPFSHLAPLHVERIKMLIDTEKVKKAIVITDHMYRHIIDTSDTIYLLQNGTTKLIEDLKDLEDYNYLSVGSLT